MLLHGGTVVSVVASQQEGPEFNSTIICLCGFSKYSGFLPQSEDIQPGNYVILPCDNAPDMCSMVTWFYNREPSQTIQVVYHGDVKNSTQAARLSLHSDCSLCINNITTEDAGVYNCRPEGTTGQDTTVYLNILTTSPSNPDLQMNGSITLKCSLFRLSSLPCDEISIRWVDDTGTVLLDKVRYTGRTCISLLTVKLHSDQNKRYTCQIVEENNVKMEAHYTPVFIGRLYVTIR
uniref:Ig-like domain-containing protein n=1 Tax=Oreochromis aureus TaxID=47969 RepID=A0A668TXC7_OREAU